MKNKIIFGVPLSQYGNTYRYYCTIANEIMDTYPIDVEIMEDTNSVDVFKIKDELKNGAKLVCVDGFLLNENNPRIEELIDKYSDSIIYYYRSTPLLNGRNLTYLKGKIRVYAADESYCAYIKKYYGIDAKLLISPVARIAYPWSYERRGNEVLFVGNYREISDAKKDVEDNVSEALKDFSEGLMKRMEEDWTVGFDECVIKELEKMGKKPDKEFIKVFANECGGLYFDYRTVCLTKRIIDGLLKAGIGVSVVGQGWKAYASKLSGKRKDLLRVEEVPPVSNTFPNFMAGAKRIITIESEYNKGIGEHTATAIATGANVYAVSTPYSESLKKNNNHIFTYDPSDIKGLVSMLKSNKPMEPVEKRIPDEISVKHYIDFVLELFYGKDYERKLLKDVKSSLVKTREFSYVKKTEHRLFILDKGGSIKTNADTSGLSDALRAKTVYTGVMSGTDNPLEVLRAFPNRMPYKVYMVPDNYDKALAIIKEFKIEEAIKNRILLFKSGEALEEYLKAHEEEYLPRMIYNNEEYYRKMTDRLHAMRLKNKRNSKIKPLITIAIPSFERGGLALNLIRSVIKSEFDSEVEFIVADNCSDKTSEKYEKIASIKDSRLRYVRNKENYGYLGNIVRITELAKGKFIYYSSDEDSFFAENLANVIDVIIREKRLDIIQVNGIGNGEILHFDESFITNDLYQVIDAAASDNYLTGICINVDNLRQRGIAKIAEKYKDNSFFNTYPHAVYEMMAIKYGKLAVVATTMYRADDTDNVPVEWILRYNTIEKRTQYQEDIVDITLNEITDDEYIQGMVVCGRIKEAYRLVSVAWSNYHEEYEKQGETLDGRFAALDAWRLDYLERILPRFSDSVKRRIIETVDEECEEAKTDFKKYFKEKMERLNAKNSRSSK